MEAGLMQKSEHMTVLVPNHAIDDIDGVEKCRSGKGPHISTGLKQWGDEGWEVCGVAGSQSSGIYSVFLKRPKP
jgi:hypothetical protein